MNRIFLACLWTLTAAPALAWTEPARGSQDRSGMLDALRPTAEWLLGDPVEFVVDQMRVDGDVGFAAVAPQRPGGGQIDLADTPMVLRDQQDPEYLDGTHMEALFIHDGAGWVVAHSALGATDVWYADPAYCAAFAAVLDDFCS